MAGIQRFVTYLYLYEQDQKLRGTGFAKIEIRGEQCRIEIHMKDAGITGETSPVYLFTREAGGLTAVEIGTIALRNGTGDYKGMIKSSGIAHSSYNISDMKGILILVNDRYMFASQWDDAPVTRRKIAIWQPQIVQPQGVPVQKMQSQNAEQQSVAQQSNTQRQNAAQHNAGQQSAAQQSNMQPQNTAQQSVAQQSNTQRQNAEQQSVALQSNMQPQNTAQQSAVQQNMQRQMGQLQNAALPQEGVLQENGRELSGNDQAPVTIKATEMPMRRFMQGKEKETLLDSFLRLQKRAEDVDIFETEHAKICGIHIELRDIRELPKSYWYLGNNSFLLHGFFSYRYLLLGKRMTEGREAFFLGVPGVLQNQERVMAALFGFAEFLPETGAEVSQESRQEVFGYWCHTMLE